MPAIVAGVSLVLATVAVHVCGLSILVRCLTLIVPRDVTRGGRPLILQIVLAVTLSVVVLHLIEVAIWAAFYRAAAGFDDWPTAVYFSLGAYSTVGAESVVLPREWRVLKGVEAMVGALMYGLSTAFLFAVVNEIHHRWRHAG